MAGLEKYEASEEWKNKLKKHLFMERKPVQIPPETIIDSQRYSMDISADLQNILKEKNIPGICNTPKSSKKEVRHQDKENDSSKWNRVHLKDYKFAEDFVDDTLLYENVKSRNKQDISDESFEAMEKICNKTASDPNSTLFKYIHSDNKRGIIEETKKRLSAITDTSTGENDDDDEEDAAINRLLNDLRENQEAGHHRKANEMTQIEDIEEPSQFWENTMVQTSPVKMVGLLRPSTILEEGGGDDDYSEGASSVQTSFRSAVKEFQSEISSSCYETASETATTENACDPLCIDDFKNENLQVDPLCLQENNLIDINESKNLIDFEKPAKVINNDQTAVDDHDYSPESDESVIELLSDDDENPMSPFCKNDEEDENFSCERQTTLIKWETPVNVKKEASYLNYSDKKSSNGSLHAERNSLHFNDTLEEVEYMMQKGMELRNAQNPAHESNSKTASQVLPTVDMLKERQNTFTKSPTTGKTGIHSEYNAAKHKEVTPHCTPVSKPKNEKPENRFALNMKPIPKFELFKKPTSASKPTGLGARPKDQFAHVVSPIATYVKKTAVTPFMTSMKVREDYSNPRAFRELEYESRLHKSKCNNFESIKLERIPNARTLPKKAYISSELRQITDERTPVTIPGGAKIQKYLDSAVTPAVICHDGKAKLPSIHSKHPVKFQKTGESKSNTPKRNEPVKDMSLANLSLMSGDVSVYTIKDAQKL